MSEINQNFKSENENAFRSEMDKDGITWYYFVCDHKLPKNFVTEAKKYALLDDLESNEVVEKLLIDYRCL